jgi:predicted RNase H-like nuclease (RuvC/YqgF family)
VSEDVLISVISTLGIVAVALIGRWSLKKAVTRRRRVRVAAGESVKEAARHEQADAAIADYENNPGAFVERVLSDNAQKHEELKALSERFQSLETQFTALRVEVQGLRDKYTRKMSAVARILRAIADQWPSAHGPNLDPRDIEEIEDTIPVQWIRRAPADGPIQPL